MLNRTEYISRLKEQVMSLWIEWYDDCLEEDMPEYYQTFIDKVKDADAVCQVTNLMAEHGWLVEDVMLLLVEAGTDDYTDEDIYQFPYRNMFDS